MKKFKVIRITILFAIIILLMQNKTIARYYEVLDTIKVRFTVEEKLNTGERSNYEITGL